jgi:hypothetical protein
LPTERLSDGKSSSTECLEWLIQAIECADTQIAQARAVQSKLIDRLKTIAPLNRLADDKRYWSFVDWKAHYDSPATNPRLNMDLCFIRLTLNSKRLSLPFASAQLIVLCSPPPAPEADGNLTDCKELCFQWSAPQMPKFIVDLPAKEPLLNGEGSFIQYLWMRLRDADQADSTEKTVLVDCRRFDVLDFIRPPVEQHKNTTGSYLGDAAYFNECGLAQDRRPPTTLVDGVATAAETETLKLMICADLSDVEYGRQLERSFRKLLPVLLGDGIDPAELRRIITDAQTAAFLCPFNDYEAVQCLLSDCIMADEQRCLQIQIKIIHPDTRTRLAVVDAIKYRLQLLGASILFETNDLAFELAASKFPDY